MLDIFIYFYIQKFGRCTAFRFAIQLRKVYRRSSDDVVDDVRPDTAQTMNGKDHLCFQPQSEAR